MSGSAKRNPRMNKRNLNRLAALIGAAYLAAPAFGQPSTAADAIYVGGDIVTMNDKAPSAQALAVKDGRILAVGDRKTVEAGHKGAKTRVVNLAGKTLLPAFIDAHSQQARRRMCPASSPRSRNSPPTRKFPGAK